MSDPTAIDLARADYWYECSECPYASNSPKGGEKHWEETGHLGVEEWDGEPKDRG